MTRRPIVPNVFSRTPSSLRRRIPRVPATKSTRPTATFDGVHLHDDLLEDFSRPAIDAQVRDARRLRPPPGRDRSGAADRHRAARASGARGQHPRAAVRARSRSAPGSAARSSTPTSLATSLAGQALFDYAPLAERARRVAVEAAAGAAPDAGGARQHQGSARHLRQGRPREPARHAALHPRRSAARVRRSRTTCTCSAISPTRRPKPRPRSAPTSSISRTTSRRARKGSFRLGRERVRAEAAARRRHHARRRTPARRSRCASCRRRRRNSAASRRGSNGGDPLAAWQKAKADHPPAGPAGAGRAAAARRARRRSSSANASSRCPRARRSSVRADAAVLPLDVRQHVDARSVRDAGRCARSTTSPTSIRRGRRSGRTSTCATSTTARCGRSRFTRCFPATSSTISTCARCESTLRKSILFSSSAFVEGWAHYCEQMMVDEGFRKNDPGVRLGQLAEALIRLCRCIVGIRLHCEDMSVEQGVRFFREEAFLEEASARREAERGTFDPSYILYSAGKLMLLKLREDYKAHVGAKFSLRGVPRHAARQRHRADLAAPGADARREQNGDDDRVGPSTMPLYEYECDACAHRFERIQKFSDPLDRRRARRAAARSASCSRRRRFSSRDRAGTSPTTRRRAAASESSTVVEVEASKSESEDATASRRSPTVEIKSDKSSSVRRSRRRRSTSSSDSRVESRLAASEPAVVSSRSMPRRYSANGPARSGRRSAKYTTAFRNPSLLPVSWRTPSTRQP